jgi:hypothetical protein
MERGISTAGWEQVRAGTALIEWSKLARWDRKRLVLVAVKEEDFEPAGHQAVHKEFGRLICWITFALGSEYLAKGVCLLKGQKLSKCKKVIRPPSVGEDINTWVRMVKSKDPSIFESDVSFGTLDDANRILEKILKDRSEKDLTLASLDLLRSTIRNRDAHRYARNVRAFHFHTVERLLVPALNTLLASLNQDGLRDRMSS